jgi:hypothetical protein
MRVSSDDHYDQIHGLEFVLLICYTGTIGGITGSILSISLPGAGLVLVGLVSSMASMISIIPWMFVSRFVQKWVDDFNDRNVFESEIKEGDSR